jgi:hypothetical protein
VGEPAAGDPSGRAGGVERRRVELDLLLGRLDRGRRAATSCSCGRGRGGDGDGEARGGGGEGARRGGGGVEEAREERLAGAVEERHRRREIRKIRPSRGAWRGWWCSPRALTVAWLRRRGGGEYEGAGFQLARASTSLVAAAAERGSLSVGPSD